MKSILINTQGLSFTGGWGVLFERSAWVRAEKVRAGEWFVRWLGVTCIHRALVWQVLLIQFKFHIVTCLSIGKGLGVQSLSPQALVRLQRAPCSGSFWLVVFVHFSLCTSYLGSESKPRQVQDSSLLGVAQSNQGGWPVPVCPWEPRASMCQYELRNRNSRPLK